MELVISGGPVFLAETSEPVAAVGVSGGRIMAMGAMDDVFGTLGGDATYIDLDGRLLVPGFQDAHIHPTEGGLARMRCNLEFAVDRSDAFATIAGYVADQDHGVWTLGAGWKYDWFDGGNPSAQMLDRLTDRPTYLVVADGHSGWANNAALQAAGISADTSDPVDGVIVRLPDGEPQGTLHEGAMKLMDEVLPADTSSDIEQALLESQDYLLSLGITAWHDAWVTPEIDIAYRRLTQAGDLKVQVRGALWWDRHRGMEQLEAIIECASREAGRYVPRTVKLMLDGVCENHTASMLDPYLDGSDRPTENRGIDFIDPADLPEIVTRIDAAGLQCHFHALGDRAVRNALDAVEQARQVNGMNDTRPHLAHIQVVDPLDVPRFAELGATANMQPLWAVADIAMTELTMPYLGAARSDLQYPFGRLRSAAARLAMGSDWPVSTPDVMRQVAVAVARNDPIRGLNEPFLPEQGLSVAVSLEAATAGSAYVNFTDHDSGTLEVGARADLAVLSGNPFTDPIHELSVDMTILDGSIVYDSAGVG